ncbi:MAG: PilZ domain-containing protein [Deltaproteobacteria bacterium]|nr:PilZ domain-containing protein [Deltaproteobacteria bacterium]
MLTVEKRKQGRVPFTERVDYYCWDQRRSAEALEISADGIFLRSPDVLPEGSMLTLRVRLPGLARGFTVLGRVVHVVLGGAALRRGMGIHFLDIAPRDRDCLASYVAQRPRLVSA